MKARMSVLYLAFSIPFLFYKFFSFVVDAQSSYYYSAYCFVGARAASAANTSNSIYFFIFFFFSPLSNRAAFLSLRSTACAHPLPHHSTARLLQQQQQQRHTRKNCLLICYPKTFSRRLI
jgi:hypothetical protein